ncbi:phytoene desaturase family protein [Natranaerofaba carboxydovora]|uniref:phytoene desaturase family protein n=1 Tax=Natranaerofaba carboxydovora TaxID=2742683 RepID=UPI001F130972|nr:FAD-dependent oxidoreductase [Natranaerofaba carboxydovora]UMZ72797.1 Flavin containing amine oxidoreductase [Natranaerofaba carboxydovora]
MKKIVIIGGGIAGLSAGIFAQKNGFESIILEKHHTLGGECTGWDREGYHIDGCIHWLVGTKENTPINDLWKTVGALDSVDIHNPESFLAYEHEGVRVHFYRDLERLKSSWIEISPKDSKTIIEMCQDIEKLQSFEIPIGKPADLMNIVERIKQMMSMKDAGMIIQKYGKISLQEYAKRFKHPALRGILATFVPEGFSASMLFFALSTFTKGQASIPHGGSREFAGRMADRYLSLGGKVEKNCEVTKLEIKNNIINQITCQNGKIFEADYFIAACDAKVLYDKLLKGKYPDKDFEKRFNNPDVYPLASEIRIALGYQGTIAMDDIPRSIRFDIDPFEINQTPIEQLLMTHYGYEPNFAPKDRTVITVSINQYYNDLIKWKSLSRESEEYQQEKARIGQEVKTRIEKKFPHMQGKLKVLDVATPKTFERYCNAYMGSFMAFHSTINGKMMNHSGKIKGLNNIFLSGQWLQPPGGLPNAVITGKDTIMRITKKKKKAFVS